MREGVIHPVRVYDEWEAMLVMDLSSVSNVQIGTDIIGPSTPCNFVHTLSSHWTFNVLKRLWFKICFINLFQMDPNSNYNKETCCTTKRTTNDVTRAVCDYTWPSVTTLWLINTNVYSYWKIHIHNIYTTDIRAYSRNKHIFVMRL